MRARATIKHLRIAPTKLRRTVDLVRGKPLEEALALLQFAPTRGARLIEKALRSAAANAENNHAMERDDLWVAEARVEAGLTLKRLRRGPRGLASLIRKRLSHVTLVLGDEEERPA
jgi:large subunit ribosomal protein L22